MLINGIRHKLGSESDARRSASFMRYLIHYLQMFAYMGAIIPIVIGIDYFLTPETKKEVVIERYYQIMNQLNDIEYHFRTDSYHFLSDKIFFENTDENDEVTFYYTPIFKTITDVTHRVNQSVYVCKPNSIYGWPLIVVGLTFICSIIMIIKTWGWIKKRNHIKYDSVVNLGVLNAFLCAITIIAILFHIPY